MYLHVIFILLCGPQKTHNERIWTMDLNEKERNNMGDTHLEEFLFYMIQQLKQLGSKTLKEKTRHELRWLNRSISMQHDLNYKTNYNSQVGVIIYYEGFTKHL